MVKPVAGYRPLAYSSPEAVQTTGTVARVGCERVGDFPRREPVESGFGDFDAAVFVLTGEGDDSEVGALALAEIVAHRVEVLDRALDPGGHDHGPGLAADLAEADDLLVEMVDHDFGL